MLPALSGGWAGYFHVTLVCVPGTVISRPQLSRTRYERLPELSVDASQPNETLHDVLPVERRFDGFVGAFRSADTANAGEPGKVDASGAVASRHAATRTRIDPARAAVDGRIEAPWLPRRWPQPEDARALTPATLAPSRFFDTEFAVTCPRQAVNARPGRSKEAAVAVRWLQPCVFLGGYARRMPNTPPRRGHRHGVASRSGRLGRHQ